MWGFGGQSGTGFRFRTNVLGAVSLFRTDRDRTLPLGTDRIGSSESFPAWNNAVVEWLLSNYSLNVCVCRSICFYGVRGKCLTWTECLHHILPQLEENATENF